jgi:hypothetical protein
MIFLTRYGVLRFSVENRNPGDAHASRSPTIQLAAPWRGDAAAAKCLLYFPTFNSESPGSLAWPFHLILQCGRNFDRQSVTMIIVPIELLL